MNGQALAWCNKVNGKVHTTTSEIPFERLKKEGLNPLSREYIIDKISLRRVQKDCRISYAGNQYSVLAEYIGKAVAVVALDSMLAAYYEGKQIALHRISYQRGGEQMFSVLSGLIMSENISFPILFAQLIPSVIFLFWVKLWVSLKNTQKTALPQWQGKCINKKQA